MKVSEALALVRSVGVIEKTGGKLRIQFPEKERALLQSAMDTLRRGRAEALVLLGEPVVQHGIITSAQSDVGSARYVFSAAGVRIMELDGVPTIGVWSDLDGLEVREALRTFGFDRLLVRYLDGPDVPLRYKLRRVEGEPLAMSMLNEMAQQPSGPWKVRKLGKRSRGLAWAEWRAAELNRLFQQYGVTGEPSSITAGTIRDAERKVDQMISGERR